MIVLLTCVKCTKTVQKLHMFRTTGITHIFIYIGSENMY